MPAKRVPMRRVREVLRLKHECGLSHRAIGGALRLSYTTVADYVHRAAHGGLRWPLPDDLDDAELERRLFPPPPSHRERAQPDWSWVHTELERPGVTLRLLWEEYRIEQPDGYGLSRFCQLYQLWRGRLSPVMRQHHVAGEKLFVDYAGQTVEVVELASGEVRHAEIFVAVLGASNYTYAEATWSQRLPDWIGSHVRALTFIGGVPKAIVPDNLKSAIGKASWFEPTINRTYADLAAHYGTAILPARPRKPRDKAKVEAAVQVVERWVLAKLRNRRFHSLAALNLAIFELVDELNRRPSRHLGQSRLELYHQLDQPALGGLPSDPYEYAEWKECRVGIDYHVEIARHYYSVPHQLIRQPISARITAKTIELFHRGRRVAVHLRSFQQRRHTTVPEHMPSAHRRYAGWTHERLQREAHDIGPETGLLVETILRKKPHPEQGFRACLGIIRLRAGYGPDRVEAACARALQINGLSYSSVASILKNDLDRFRPANSAADGPPLDHSNIRGPSYFH
jgi:transposase